MKTHQSIGQKMYSKQTVYDAHLTSKKHVKAAAKQAESGEPPVNPNGPSTLQAETNGSGSSAQGPSRSKHRTAALLTHLATKLLANLAPALNDTKSNVERRFSLTAREREQELLEQSKPKPTAAAATAAAEGAEEEEEEERIYNPLKLPLGWDGKPIPYWLYKLHGLGVEYRCEICSDHVYMGRYVHPALHLHSIFVSKHPLGRTSTAISKNHGMHLACVPLDCRIRSTSTKSPASKMLLPVRIFRALLCDIGTKVDAPSC